MASQRVHTLEAGRVPNLYKITIALSLHVGVMHNTVSRSSVYDHTYKHEVNSTVWKYGGWSYMYLDSIV